MGEDPERIEREIERTRAKLGDDLDALEDKVNPKKVARRSVSRAKDKAADVKDKVAEAAGAAKDKVAGAAGAAKDKVGSSDGSDHPRGTSSTVAGDGTGGSSAGSAGGIAQKISDLSDAAKERVAPLATTAKDKAGSLAATAKDKAAVQSGMDPQTAETREVAAALAGSTWTMLREQIRHNPVAVGAAAFVVGFLIGH